MSVETIGTTHSDKKTVSKGHGFVSYAINRWQDNNGIRAALPRADNPATEYQSWEVLAGFKGVNLEDEDNRLPYATIGAAIARAKAQKNGSVSIGQAIARCYQDGNTDDQAKAKFRRLLACHSVAEACRIVRPLLKLVESKGNSGVNYANLLNDLLKFSRPENQTGIKARWAQDFYRKNTAGGEL